MTKRTIFILIDGLPTKKFEYFLKKGYLPNIKTMIKNGTYIPTCISSFPSVTGPAHIPIFTGKSPFFFEIAGHNQFYRNYRYFDNYLLNYANLNKQLNDSDTVYKHYKNSVAISELIYKDAKKFIRYFSGIFAWIFRSDINTTRILKRITKEYKNGRDLIVAWLPNSDAFQHVCKNDEKLAKMMTKIDRFIGELFKLKDKDTKIIIGSDHGMEKVKEKINIKKLLRDFGLNTRAMKFNFDGGGFVQIYFKNLRKNSFHKKKLQYEKFCDYIIQTKNFHETMRRLAMVRSIEFLMMDIENHTYIVSKDGIGSIKQDKNKYFYSIVAGTDPFLYSKDEIAKELIGKWITKEDSLKLSHHTKYPDAIYQTHGLLQIENAGELVITTADNVTPNFITPHGVHGGLRREQMVTPFITSEKINDTPKFMRTKNTFDHIIK